MEKSKKKGFIHNLEKNIEILQKSIDNCSNEKKEMVDILESFESRFVVLQNNASVLNNKIEILRVTHDNIDKTVSAIEYHLEFYEALGKIAPRIEQGVNNDLDSFLSSLDLASSALNFFQTHPELKGSAYLSGQLQQVRTTAIGTLEKEFRECLETASKMTTDIDPFQYRAKLQHDEPIDLQLIGSTELEVLSKISKRLSIISSANYRKDLKMIRSKVLVHVIDKIYPSAERKKKLKDLKNSLLKKNDKLVIDKKEEEKEFYEKGSHKLIFMLKFYWALLAAERKVVARMNLGLQGPAIYLEIIEASLQEIESQLEYYIEKPGKNKVFVGSDMYHIYHTQLKSKLEEILGAQNSSVSKRLDKEMEDLKLRIAQILVFFVKRLEETKEKVSDDGLVHQATSNCLGYFRRLLDYRETIEEFLGIPFVVAELFKDDKENSTYIEKYISRILQSAEVNIQQKKSEYKDKALSILFILNNHYYVLKRLKSTEFRDILQSKFIDKYKILCEIDERDFIRLSWGNVLDSLKETKLDIEKKNAPKTSQITELKKKFSAFFDTFQDVYYKHQKYNIPEVELRERMRQLMLQAVIPIYEEFHKRYGSVQFTKNPSKYMRYDVKTMTDIISNLYSNQL